MSFELSKCCDAPVIRCHMFNMCITHMWCLKCGKDIVIMTGEEIREFWSFPEVAVVNT